MADDSPRRAASAGWTRSTSAASGNRASCSRPASALARSSTTRDAVLDARVQHLEAQNRELKQKLQALRRAKRSVVVVTNSSGATGSSGENRSNNGTTPSLTPARVSSTTLPTLSASAAAAVAAAASAVGGSGKSQTASNRKSQVKAKLRGKLKRRGHSGSSRESSRAPSQAFAAVPAAPEKSTHEVQTDISGSPWKHLLVFHRAAFVEKHLSTQRQLEAALVNAEDLQRAVTRLRQRYEDREAEFKAQWDRREAEWGGKVQLWKQKAASVKVTRRSKRRSGGTRGDPLRQQTRTSQLDDHADAQLCEQQEHHSVVSVKESSVPPQFRELSKDLNAWEAIPSSRAIASLQQ